jgi:hypothetical protein
MVRSGVPPSGGTHLRQEPPLKTVGFSFFLTKTQRNKDTKKYHTLHPDGSHSVPALKTGPFIRTHDSRALADRSGMLRVFVPLCLCEIKKYGVPDISQRKVSGI